MKTINKSVKLWLALDQNNKYITIDKAINGTDYICPECHSIIHSRALNSDCMSPHFYHLNNLNSCNCTDAIKQYWKEYLIGIGEIVLLPKLYEITCIDKRIDFELHKDDITIKVDLMIKTIYNQFFVITFDKGTKYIDKLKAFKYPIFYVDIGKLKYNNISVRGLYELLSI